MHEVGRSMVVAETHPTRKPLSRTDHYMTKSDRRAELTKVLALHILEHGLARSRLVDFAAAAKTSDRMLVYYFGSKAELLASVIQQVASDLANKLDQVIDGGHPLPAAEVLNRAAYLTATPELAPYMRLGLEIYGMAASGDKTFQSFSKDIIGGFLKWTEQRIDTSDVKTRRDQAAAVLAMVEGLAVMSLGFSDTSRRRAIRAMVAALDPQSN